MPSLVGLPYLLSREVEVSTVPAVERVVLGSSGTRHSSMGWKNGMITTELGSGFFPIDFRKFRMKLVGTFRDFSIDFFSSHGLVKSSNCHKICKTMVV